MVLPVLRHRIILSFDAARNSVTSDKVIQKILEDKKQLKDLSQ
jgi:MoxR-like ATPase